MPLTPEDIARDFVAYAEKLEREDPQQFADLCAALKNGASLLPMCSVPHQNTRDH